MLDEVKAKLDDLEMVVHESTMSEFDEDLREYGEYSDYGHGDY